VARRLVEQLHRDPEAAAHPRRGGAGGLGLVRRR
jgi:hypothetical protein